MARKHLERQTKLHAVVDLTKANIGAGNEVTVGIPVNALVTAVGIFTAVAFDGTTNTGTATDGTTSYVTAADLKSAGAETAAGAPKLYPTGGTITFSMAQTGVATVGRAIGTVEYVILGRGGEIQG